MDSESSLRPGALHQVGLSELKKHRGWYLVLGILLLISGCVAISFSMLTTAISMVVIGVQLLLAGALLVVFSFRVKQWGGFFIELLMGVLYLVAGFVFVANPEASAIALTLVLSMFLMFSGIFRIVIVIMERFPHWGWVLLMGIVNLLLGISIWWQWPFSGMWVIGLFVGIEMIFNGWSLVMLSAAAGKLQTDMEEAVEAAG